MPTTDARGHIVPTPTDLASRQSLLDLSLSISDIATATSQTQAQSYVKALAAAGVKISADKPVYVNVNNTLKAWNGSTWAEVHSVVTGAPTLKTGWEQTSLRLSRTGSLVTLTGVIGRTSWAAIQASGYEIASIPTGFRPSSQSLLGGLLNLPACSYVSGASTAVSSDVVCRISPTGALWVYPSRPTTMVTIGASWSA